MAKAIRTCITDVQIRSVLRASPELLDTAMVALYSVDVELRGLARIHFATIYGQQLRQRRRRAAMNHGVFLFWLASPLSRFSFSTLAQHIAAASVPGFRCNSLDAFCYTTYPRWRNQSPYRWSRRAGISRWLARGACTSRAEPAVGARRAAVQV